MGHLQQNWRAIPVTPNLLPSQRPQHHCYKGSGFNAQLTQNRNEQHNFERMVKISKELFVACRQNLA